MNRHWAVSHCAQRCKVIDDTVLWRHRDVIVVSFTATDVLISVNDPFIISTRRAEKNSLHNLLLNVCGPIFMGLFMIYSNIIRQFYFITANYEKTTLH